jgi:histone H3/H4
MTEIIIKSKIKDVVKLRVAANLADELNKKIEEILKKAEERAKANHRTTILAQDI